MRTIRLRFLVAAALWLACMPAAFAQPVPCPGASCDVVVTVSGTPPAVSVSANELKMGKGNKNAEIVWKLQGADYEFRRDSIKPHTGAPVGTKATTPQAAWDAEINFQNQSATAYRVKNRNSVAGSLYYDVTVYNKATGAAVRLDPAIINDP
jgi:hypothetical protein